MIRVSRNKNKTFMNLNLFLHAETTNLQKPKLQKLDKLNLICTTFTKAFLLSQKNFSGTGIYFKKIKKHQIYKIFIVTARRNQILIKM